MTARPHTGSLFTPLTLRNISIPNRIVRSATYEGMGDPDGMPTPALAKLYTELARGGAGALITGFVSIAQAGRAMQPAQCGIDTDAKMEAWRRIVRQVRQDAPPVRLFMQLAHAGRQTRRAMTGLPVLGVSSKRCTYFRQKVTVLDEPGIRGLIDGFAQAARRARHAGFDGVQLHAAHGYLIHQFLSPWTNTRRDRWADRPLFLEETVRAVKAACGADYPVLIKLSAAEDATPGIRIEDTIATVKRMELLGLDAVEISYGAMEHALNIIRGACPVDLVLRVNPLFNTIPPWIRGLWKRLRAKAYLASIIPFQENYNLQAAAAIRRATSLPVIAVGGIRRLDAMVAALETHGLDGVSLCRPLIREPDWPEKLRRGESELSACTQCNLCTIYCDGDRPLRCYAHRETPS